MQIKITEEQFSQLKDSYRMGFDSVGGYGHITENSEEEVEASEVDLSSFEPQTHLADEIWDGLELNPRVRLTLLDIADDFIETLDFDFVQYKDIVLTGSICNYNWSDFSDIDIHVIYDFSEIDDNENLIRSYVDAKKQEWSANHDDLAIYGFRVELYVENSNDKPAVSNGIYSLEKNKWIKKPSKDNISLHSTDEIKEISAEFMTMIDDIELCYEAAETNSALEYIQDKITELCELIKDMRKKQLALNGEMAIGNIVYKSLRREGYIDKLYELRNSIYDEINSI